MPRRIIQLNRSKTPFHNIHSFITETFQTKERSLNQNNLATYPSFYDHNYYYVLADETELPSHLNDAIMNRLDQPTEIKQNEKITLTTRVSFSNRGKANRCTKISPAQALLQFEKHTGLTSMERNTTIAFLGVQRLKENEAATVNIMNAFFISGSFVVKDSSRFVNALMAGVGSRKNYGFGLILLDRSNS